MADVYQCAGSNQVDFWFGSFLLVGKQSSSPGESHPQALTDPDMSLSTHPAPIVQPEAA